MRLHFLGTLVLDQFPVGIEILCLLRYLKLNIPSLKSSFVTKQPSESFYSRHDIQLRRLCALWILEDAQTDASKFWLYHSACRSRKILRLFGWSVDVFARLPNLQSPQIYGDLSSYQCRLSKSPGKPTCLQYLKLVNKSKLSQLPSIVVGEYQFPPSLTQLNLSNTELKDNPIPTFETLPHLEVPKLKLNSYFGRKVGCRSRGFPQLKILHMKSMLWQWRQELCLNCNS